MIARTTITCNYCLPNSYGHFAVLVVNSAGVWAVFFRSGGTHKRRVSNTDSHPDLQRSQSCFIFAKGDPYLPSPGTDNSITAASPSQRERSGIRRGEVRSRPHKLHPPFYGDPCFVLEPVFLNSKVDIKKTCITREAFVLCLTGDWEQVPAGGSDSLIF